MLDPTASSIEEWIALAKSARTSAYALLKHPSTHNQAWSQAGFSIECLLKASIMAKERFNTWPSRGARGDLYTHDLEKLADILGMKVLPADPVAPSWSVVLQWRREHSYVSKVRPAAITNGLIDAAFSDNGVFQWISRRYLLNY